MPRSLVSRYGHLAMPLPVDGDYGVLIEPWADAPLDTILTIDKETYPLVPELRLEGEKHLQKLAGDGATMFDGKLLALHSVKPGSLVAHNASYFDGLRTIGPLLHEWNSGGPTPLRDRIDAINSGDPLHHGRGRVAGLGLACLLVWHGQGVKRFCLGKRSRKLAISPGMWHPVPAGGLSPSENVLHDTLVDEFSHELCLSEGQADVAVESASVLGMIYDLRRLCPEIIVVAHCSGSQPVADPSEHDSLRFWPYTQAGLTAALKALGPASISPTASGALGLAIHSLQTAEQTDYA